MPAEEAPKPLFLYGSLRALPLLAWAITGDETNTHVVKPLVRPAIVHGYSRFFIHHSDYPAAIPSQSGSGSIIDGYLFTPESIAQRNKLDNFEGEGESYLATPVTVELDTGERIEADMYVWNGDKDLVSDRPWELSTFIEERLEDWLDLYQGMELIG